MSFLIQAALAAPEFLSGVGKMVSAGDIGREKKKLLQVKADYNKKQIEKAYAKNYAKQMSSYASSLNNILNQKDVAESNINVASINVGDIDIQGSSFRTTSLSKLNEEYYSSMNNLSDNIYNQSIDLIEDKSKQIIDTNLQLYNARQKVNAETDALKSEGFQQVVNSAAKAISGGMMEGNLPIPKANNINNPTPQISQSSSGVFSFDNIKKSLQARNMANLFSGSNFQGGF